MHNLYGFGEDWSTNLFHSGKDWRLYGLALDARAVNQGASDDLDEETNSFELDVVALGEVGHEFSRCAAQGTGSFRQSSGPGNWSCLPGRWQGHLTKMFVTTPYHSV